MRILPERVWLTLKGEPGNGGVSVGVDSAEALTWTADDFAALYRRHVVGSTKAEARAWGEAQVRERDLALNA